jgi:hypothetical protein
VGPEAPDHPEAVGSIVFLCHASDMTLSEEQLAGACLGSGAREPQASVAQACLLVPEPWLASLARQELRAGPEGAIDREPKAQGSPQALGRSCDRVRLG